MQESNVWTYDRNALAVFFDEVDKVSILSIKPKRVSQSDPLFRDWPADIGSWRICDLRRWLETESVPFVLGEDRGEPTLTVLPGCSVAAFPADRTGFWDREIDALIRYRDLDALNAPL